MSSATFAVNASCPPAFTGTPIPLISTRTAVAAITRELSPPRVGSGSTTSKSKSP
jgi:hypothetical protein